MTQKRAAASRGKASFGWLDSRHSFSFGHYYDPAHMGFGPLRVINEDRVTPARGFETHGHKDMEILSYVLDGGLAHKDSMGTGSVIRPGDLQRMSAGTGVMHSEFNASETDPVHFLQIWILPEKPGGDPGYEQKHFSDVEKRGQWRLIASRDGRDGSVTVRQDVALYAALVDGDETLDYAVAPDRKGWLQVARGDVVVNGDRLIAGDGLAIDGGETLDIRDADGAELLLFDMIDWQ
ncbi:MAG: pirin family protein [Pseudomonadota bacterium]